MQKGQVKLIRLTAEGEEKVFKNFMPKGVIAEMAMFMPNHEYPMICVTEVDSILLSISKDALLAVVENSPVLSMKVMGFMAQRINQLMDNIDLLTQTDAQQRLVMRFAHLYTQQKTTKPAIILPVSKKMQNTIHMIHLNKVGGILWT